VKIADQEVQEMSRKRQTFGASFKAKVALAAVGSGVDGGCDVVLAAFR